MPMFLAPLVGWIKLNPRAFAIILAAIAVAFFALGLYQKGRSDQAKKEDARRAVEVQEAITRNSRATGAATEAQVRAALVQAEKEERLVKAISDVPDTVPDPVAVQLGCQRLREAGVSTADLPACRAPDR